MIRRQKKSVDIAVALSGAPPTIETPAAPSANVPPLTASEPSPSPAGDTAPVSSVPTPGKILITKRL